MDITRAVIEGLIEEFEELGYTITHRAVTSFALSFSQHVVTLHINERLGLVLVQHYPPHSAMRFDLAEPDGITRIIEQVREWTV